VTAVAQWDVYVNPSARMREVLPYLVVLQSDLLSDLGTRLVAPLARRMPPPQGVTERLSPSLVVQGEALTLVVQESAPIDARALRTPVASVRSEAHRIVDALDAVVSGV
jgi:toxin CcdB